jgi:hypothetical protein
MLYAEKAVDFGHVPCRTRFFTQPGLDLVTGTARHNTAQEVACLVMIAFPGEALSLGTKQEAHRRPRRTVVLHLTHSQAGQW